MSAIANEQTKLLANALDRASTACFTVGILTPLAGYVYGVVDFAPDFSPTRLAALFAAWMLSSTVLHLFARRVLRGFIA